MTTRINKTPDFSLPGYIFFPLLEKIRSIIHLFSLINESDFSGDDESLIAMFLNGSRKAFDALVMRHMDMVFNLCYNITGDYDEANDCAQDVFISVYKNLGKFEGRSAFSTWLYRIAVNTCRNRVSSAYKKRTLFMGDESGSFCSDMKADPAEMFDKEERVRAVREGISRLPSDERILIVLRDIEGRSYEEISAITDLKEGTVKSRISRGRHRLREYLKGVMS
jgi:RNA polymerase sigma-70 factor (ECF subfamily)